MAASLRVLIAPDSFGNTLSAAAAAGHIADGWATARPGDTLVLAPQSDGGPGFVEILAAALPGGVVREVTISGPLGDPVPASYLRVGEVAYIESAQACGLHLLPDGPNASTALAANTRGVGELALAAIDDGATGLVVGLGGSASTDGGAGFLNAFGGFGAARAALAGIDIVAASDVEHPLHGEHGAAVVFGPQKGARSPELVAELANRLRELTHLDDVAETPGAGAAGGLGAALFAVGAHRESGADLVAALTDQGAQLDAADLIITGEGSFDAQSLRGKLVSALAARAGGKPVLVLAGRIGPELDDPAALVGSGIIAIRSLVAHCGSVEVAMTEAAAQLRELAATVGREYPEVRYR